MLCRDSSALLQGGKEGGRQQQKQQRFPARKAWKRQQPPRKGLCAWPRRGSSAGLQGGWNLGQRGDQVSCLPSPHLRAHLEGPWAQEGILVPGQLGGHGGDGPSNTEPQVCRAGSGSTAKATGTSPTEISERDILPMLRLLHFSPLLALSRFPADPGAALPVSCLPWPFTTAPSPRTGGMVEAAGHQR